MVILRTWFAALRPRTLLLVISGTIAALAVAYPHDINWITAALVLITALSLQILSNLANDYGDSVHGADNEARLGPTRSVQSGIITQSAMKRAMVFAALVSAASGFLLLIYVYRMVGPLYFVGFFVIGALAIWAAIAYTATANPYGYRGLGDLMVFVFFGPIIVAGGGGLIGNLFTIEGIILGTGFGLISTGVLNINNMRDLENDRQVGKNTIAVIFGPRRAKLYHTLLIVGIITTFSIFSTLFTHSPWGWSWVAVSPLLVLHLAQLSNREPHELDSLIPQLAVFSLLSSITFFFQSTV